MKYLPIVYFCFLFAFCLLPLKAQNLIDSNDWITGTSGATTNYVVQGSDSQNSRISMLGPYGNQVTVWRAAANGASGMNGGFVHNGLLVDTSKAYRISFWVYSNGPNGCTNYLGFIPRDTSGALIQPFEAEDGGTTSWPYFNSMNHPNGTWRLVVGYIRPSNIGDASESGVYDPSLGSISNIPNPSDSATDFIFPNGLGQMELEIRSFMWNCGSGEEMFIYDPRIEEASNTTPLANLIYGTGSSDTQAPTASTLTSTGQSDTTADLSWSGATDNVGVTGYTLFQDNVQVQTNITATTYQVTGLTPSTAYNFKVQVYDAAGNQSPDSNTLPITTDADPGNGGGNPGTSVWTESNTTASYSGEVAIGRSSVPANYKLAVEGHIRAREIRVDTESWPDYVFKDGYHLPSIEDIQKHIQEKGHLPNIPSAREVAERGIALGEMDRLLLEKIEELTLYIIELKTEIKELKSK